MWSMRRVNTLTGTVTSWWEKVVYRICLNNSRPSIKRLPRIITPFKQKYLNNAPPPPPNPSCRLHFFFFIHPSCQVEMESDPAILISRTIQALTPRIFTTKINQGTRFGTLEKPMFTVYLMCSFFYFGLKKQNILGSNSREQFLK